MRIPSSDTITLIEAEEFAFEFISVVAERESWRKEINRPIYHLHKWWAKRLGSVFRGVLLGCVLPPTANFEEAFYSSHSFPQHRVLDPFMGSGTTLGEAAKLGMTVLGRDINPVAYEAVRVALGPLNRRRLADAFESIECSVGARIRALYGASGEADGNYEVMYYFWVKHVPCPSCRHDVDLFSSYVFARNAYPERKPEVQVLCPCCSAVFQSLHGLNTTTCPLCAVTFDPCAGPVTGQSAECRVCSHKFSVSKTVQKLGGPPLHRLYAKLVLMENGEKKYLSSTDADREAFANAERLLFSEEQSGGIRLPLAVLRDGYNTRQAIGYHYRSWRQFFNSRQLLALGWLQRSISDLAPSAERDALLLLFSGVLEFNNLFTSYKGEGTGAVRHMFSNHVLKPERIPIETNVWGLGRGSGSFSGLYKSRLLRALDYRENPFELTAESGAKVGVVAGAIGTQEIAPWPQSGQFKTGSVSLSCGNSADLAIPDGSIDWVVTDPPFFDNVHYSELADFFYAWQALTRSDDNHSHGSGVNATTRAAGEVQDTDAAQFASKLRTVFGECHRVLKDQGLLVFTYHHSRSDGWGALAQALYGGGFSIVRVHPVRSELAVAAPKSRSSKPILMDAILVCRKADRDLREKANTAEALTIASDLTRRQFERLARVGQRATHGDCVVILTAQFLAALGPVDGGTAGEACDTYADALNELAESVFHAIEKAPDNASVRTGSQTELLFQEAS